MSEAERLIRGLVEMLDVVLHTGEVPKGADRLLEDVRIYCAIRNIGRERIGRSP
jgi:hypothetical protein